MCVVCFQRELMRCKQEARNLQAVKVRPHIYHYTLLTHTHSMHRHIHTHKYTHTYSMHRYTNTLTHTHTHTPTYREGRKRKIIKESERDYYDDETGIVLFPFQMRLHIERGVS